MNPDAVTKTAPSPLAGLIEHALFRQARDSLLRALLDPDGAPIPFVIGAPGFGKTRLLQVVANAVAWDSRAEMADDPNVRPVISIEALAPERGNFDMRLAFLQILHELGDLGAEHRTGGPFDPETALEREAIRRRARGSKSLQLDVIRAIQEHRTKVLLIDEINHMTYVNDVARYQATLDILKSITNATGCRIVCVGSYDAIGFRSVSGQLIRREQEVHARRYRAEVPAEYAEYGRVVQVMLDAIAFKGPPEPLVTALYRASVGTIGETRLLLGRAHFAAGFHGESLDHGLARTLPDDAPTRVMAQQIVDGERAFGRSPKTRTELDDLIGLTPTRPLQRAPGRGNKPDRRTLKPGHTRPSRYPVGASHGQ